MNALRPQAFVSFNSADRGTALRAVTSLEHVGFEVWHMDTGTSAGDDWLDEYERQLIRAHVMVAIVSMAYLGQEQCRNEARRAHKRFTKRKMLVAPVVVEPIDSDSLDEDTELMLERLLDHGGLATAAPPSDTELDSLAESLALQVRDKGIWPRGSDGRKQTEGAIEPASDRCDESFGATEEGHSVPGIDDAASADHPTAQSANRTTGGQTVASVERRVEAEEPPGDASVAMPFTERWSPSGTRVTLELKAGVPGAHSVQAWFLKKRMRSTNGRMWTIDRDTYEAVVKDALVDAVTDALKERSHG